MRFKRKCRPDGRRWGGIFDSDPAAAFSNIAKALHHYSDFSGVFAYCRSR
jgi:hypothetical protein